MDKFIPSQSLVDLAIGATVTIGGATDEPADVSLIEVPFTATKGIDEATIPASANFAAINSGVAPSLIPTPGSGGKSILWEDPVGGWDFISIGSGFPKTFYGYRIDSDSGNFLGCQTITPITITGTNQHILLGVVRLPANGDPFTGN